MTEAKAKVPAILDAIAAIQAEVGKVPKNGQMDFKNTKYTYVKNDDILEAVQTQLVLNNVIVKPEILSYAYETRDLGANRFLPMVVVELRQTYISATDGSEYATVVWGEGAGGDDKGLRKAVTTAQKIANLLTFSIATGEPDPDSYPSGPTEAASTGPTKAEVGVAKARGAGPSATEAPANDIQGLRRKLKADAGKKGLASADLNALGLKTDKGADYFNHVDSLKWMIQEVEKIGVSE